MYNKKTSIKYDKKVIILFMKNKKNDYIFL